MPATPQTALELGKNDKTELRLQVAALCYRVRKDKVQVLLVTSRGTGRWILPKGWPIDGMTPAEAAAREAFEEAGVGGKPYDACVGTFHYDKSAEDQTLPCVAMVFPVKVKTLLEDWPERRERRRKWYPLRKAALKVQDQGLRGVIEAFDPRSLKG